MIKEKFHSSTVIMCYTLNFKNQLTYPFNNKSETKKDVFLLHNNKGNCKLYAARDSYLDHKYQYLFPLLL